MINPKHFVPLFACDCVKNEILPIRNFNDELDFSSNFLLNFNFYFVQIDTVASPQ